MIVYTIHNIIKSSIDIIILIITFVWLSDLDFNELTSLQIVGLILVPVMIVLMIIKLLKGVNNMDVKSTEANKRWQSKNKEYSNYLKSRSTARSFIKNKAKKEDLDELEALIIERRKSM